MYDNELVNAFVLLLYLIITNIQYHYFYVVVLLLMYLLLYIIYHCNKYLKRKKSFVLSFNIYII